MKTTFWSYRLPDAAGYQQAASLLRQQTPSGAPDIIPPTQPSSFDLPRRNFGALLNFIDCSATDAGAKTSSAVQDLTGAWLVKDVVPDLYDAARTLRGKLEQNGGAPPQ